MTPEDRDFLIRTVIGESARQPREGQEAVAHVIKNRARAGSFGGNTIRDVVLAPNQFEPWGTRAPELKAIPTNSPIYVKTAAMVDSLGADPTGGATYFLNEPIVRDRRGGSLPDWANKRAASAQKIGDHTFYGGTQVAQNTGQANDARLQALKAELVSRQGGQNGQSGSDRLQALKSELARRQGGGTSTSPVDTPQARPSGQSTVSGLLDKFTEGATLGYGDKLTATEAALSGELGEAVAGVAPGISRALGIGQSPAQTYQERYDAALAAERGQQEQFGEEHPYLSPVAEIAGAVAGTAAALPARALTAATRLGTMGRGAAVGAGEGAIYGSSEGEGLAERAQSAGLSAGLGLAGGVVAPPVMAAVGWALKSTIGPLARIAKSFFTKPQFYGPQGITEQGRQVLAKIGVDADDVSRQMGEAFEARAKTITTPESAARAAQFDEFGVPAFRQNVSGAADDWAFFEGGRRGKFSPRTTEALQAASSRQGEAVKQAGEDIGVGMAGRDIAQDSLEAGGMVRNRLIAEKDTAKAMADAAYTAFDESGAMARGNTMGSLGGRLIRAVNDEVEGFGIDTPSARRVLKRVGTLIEEGKRGAVPIQQVERVRQLMNSLKPTGADVGSMKAIKNEFDDWFDDLMTNGLMNGDEGVQVAVKKARKLWSEYLKTYGGKDAGYKFITKMVEAHASPEQAAKWLFGASRAGSGTLTSTQAKTLRDVIGEASPEWQAVRQAMWGELTAPSGRAVPGPQKMASEIKRLLEGPSRALAEVLYSPEEIAKMKRFKGLLDKLTPPEGTVNYSGTGYENARTVRQAMQALSGIIGGASGGPAGAVAGAGATKAVQAGSDWLRTKALLKGIPLKPRSAIAGAAVAPLAGAGGALLAGGPQ